MTLFLSTIIVNIDREYWRMEYIFKFTNLNHLIGKYEGAIFIEFKGNLI